MSQSQHQGFSARPRCALTPLSPELQHLVTSNMLLCNAYDVRRTMTWSQDQGFDRAQTEYKWIACGTNKFIL